MERLHDLVRVSSDDRECQQLSTRLPILPLLPQASKRVRLTRLEGDGERLLRLSV